MQIRHNARLRARLLATSSALAVAIGGCALLAPTGALAANECGDPNANGGAPDTLTCPPAVYGGGITYPVTNGDLTLTLQESAAGAVNAPGIGLKVTASGSDSVVVNRSGGGDGGDPVFSNPGQPALFVAANLGTATLDLTDPDAGDTPISVSTTSASPAITVQSSKAATLIMPNGTVSGVILGVNVFSTSATGTVSITGGAKVTVTDPGNVAYGVLGQSSGGAVTVNWTGPITATGKGGEVLAALSQVNGGGGAASITTSDVTASADGGPDAIGVLGQSQTGAVNVTSGVAVASGKNGTGFVAAVEGESKAGGAVKVQSGSLTASNKGVSGLVTGLYVTTTGKADVVSGAVNVTGEGLKANGGITYGIGLGLAKNLGDTTLKSTSVTVTAPYGYGIGVTAAGNVTIDSGTVTTSGGATGGIGVETSTGSVVVTSGVVSATGKGSIGITIDSGKDATLTTGAITADAGGVKITAVGNASVTTTGVINTASVDGMNVSSTKGSVSVVTGAAVNGVTSGVTAYTTGGGAVSVDTTGGAVTAVGPSAFGVEVVGGGTVTVKTGSVSAPNTDPLTPPMISNTNVAISASGDANTTVSVSTFGAILGTQTGIAANGGTVSIVTNNPTVGVGSVTSSGAGISTFSVKGGTTVVANTVVSAGSVGIGASSNGGDTTVTTNASVSGGDFAAINAETHFWPFGKDTEADAGLLKVTVNGNASSTTGDAILTYAVRSATVSIGANATVTGAGSTAHPVVDLVTGTFAGNSTVMSNAGVIVSNKSATLALSDLAVRAIGGSILINNSGRITGRMDFAGVAAGFNATVNNTSSKSWHTSGLTTFTAGNDVLNNAAGGLIGTTAATTFDFAGDTGTAPRDVFTNAGVLVVGETAGASTLTLTGLESLANSGSIFLGSTNGGTASDGETNDRLVMSGTGGGTAFVGSGASTIYLDANLGGASQANCAAAVSADCISAPAGAFTGSTKLRLNNINTTAGGLNGAGLVLVDAGSIAAGAFVIDPASAGYVTRGGAGAIDTGLFFYRLVPGGTTQLALVSAPDSEAFEFDQLGGALTDIWRTTTGTWHDRQADLRDSLGATDESHRGGVWLKVAGDWAKRTSAQSFTSSGTVFTFDTSYRQTTWAIIGGVDLINAGGDSGNWVFGVDAGYAHSDVRFQASSTRTAMTGGVFGGYVSWVKGAAFVDATLNANFLKLEDHVPSLGATFITSGDAHTVGGQVEAGWKAPLGESVFIEPLGSLTYVRGSIDSLPTSGGAAVLDNVDSFRGSVGVRLGAETEADGARIKGVVTARVWDEWNGSQAVALTNPGTTLLTSDKLDGVFGDVGGQLEMSNGGQFSAFVNVGYRWNSTYRDTRATAGFRVQF